MITVEELKQAIKDAKKMEGSVFIGYSSSRVYVTANCDVRTFKWQHHVLFWFHPTDVNKGIVTVNDGYYLDSDFNYTLEKLVESANNYETKKSLT